MVTVKQQAGNFPSVGMTLRSYKYDPKDYHKRAGEPLVVKGGRFKRFRQKITLKRVVITLAILIALLGGFLGYKFMYNAHKIFGGNILGVLHSTKLKGEDTGRVNILLAGNSADDAGHNGGELTDSIMLVSIDTKNHKAWLLSIPRDLWVDIGGEGHQKINAAYVQGKEEDFHEDGYAEGGMGQLEQVVSESFGLPINYYALINYNAFKDGVDAVGGIDVTIKSEDPRGLYDPNIDWTTGGPLVKLSNGRHHLNGQQALDLARARGDAYNSYGFAQSDFARTSNQRMMMIALKDKAISAGTLANPAKVSSLADALGDNVKTDFEISEVRRLYDIMKDIPSSNIQSLSLNDVDGESLLASYTAPGGQSALIPAAGLDDFSDIQAFINRQTSDNPVVQEGATVVVLNGTSSAGLAGKIKSQLSSQNINVKKAGDADNSSHATTTIIDNSKGKMPATRAALVKKFGNHVTTQDPYAGMYEADFIVVLGSDQAAKNTSANTSQ
jgi:LCP family protein required for cell wall assembly